MDLNPRPPSLWTSREGPYEIADYCRSTEGKNRTNVLLLLNAWLDTKEDPESKWDLQTLNYWTARLRPLWDIEHGNDPTGNKGATKETIVVICNRCGADNGKQPNSTAYNGINEPFFCRDLVRRYFCRAQAARRDWRTGRCRLHGSSGGGRQDLLGLRRIGWHG